VWREARRGDVYVCVGVGEEAFSAEVCGGGVSFVPERRQCRVSQRRGMSRQRSR
jgi:hypothetical protein